LPGFGKSWPVILQNAQNAAEEFPVLQRKTEYPHNGNLSATAKS
jgi:hypothetical protein